MLLRYVALVQVSLFFITSCEVSQKGTFWHVTDLHLDFYYDETNNDPAQVCPSSFGAETPDAGLFGDYRCDSPWSLVRSAVEEMKRIEPNPNFIIWTGDDTLHTSDEDKFLSEELVIETVHNLTNLLKASFPNTTVHAALGNHDYHYKSQIPPGPSSILSAIANDWRDWMTDEQFQMFNQTGCFIREIAPKVDLISLNTNVWYTTNKVVTGMADPGGYFAWFEQELEKAKSMSKKVYVIGHVPPGHFELVDYKYWYYPEYNVRYVEIIKKYSDVIIGQFFGHHHTDTFRMFYDNNGNAVSSLLIAPGVTPWMTTLPGADDGANNPGIRLFEYDATTMEITDYVQYYLDLAAANMAGKADWVKEYRATSDLGIPDMSVASWEKLSKRLESANVLEPSSPDTILLQKFVNYNSVLYNLTPCNRSCQLNQVCAIRELDYGKYKDCVSDDASIMSRSISFTVAVALIVSYRNIS